MEKINKIIELLQFEVDSLNMRIKPTTTNKRDFERNCRTEFLVEQYQGRLDYLTTWKENIGSTVYKTVGRNSYSNTIVTDSWSKTETEPIVFTEELYVELVKYMFNYWIKYIIGSFAEQPIVSNSSCKLTNLLFEWELESKQEALRFYKILQSQL